MSLLEFVVSGIVLFGCGTATGIQFERRRKHRTSAHEWGFKLGRRK